MSPNLVRSIVVSCGVALLFLFAGGARAVTYANASTPIAWVDPIAGAHTRIGYNTNPKKFNGGGGCGTTPPTLDDTLSDSIDLETRGSGYPAFNFWFAGNSYSSLRISTNGRLQFGNTTCGHGTTSIGPPQTYPYTFPNGSMNNVMKVFGADLDPTDLVDSPNYPSSSARTSCKRSGTGANNCGIYVATTGTAPYRTFVVTWLNVPEWVNYANTSGSFSIQVILQENGEFIFQYLNILHGGTGTAEVGWQVDSQDYDVLQFAGGTEPPNNTAIKFYIPQAVAEYRMEQPSWSPTGNPVLDTSGNLRHASLATAGSGAVSPSTTASGKVCRGAVIPDNSTATVVNALATPFSMQTVGSQGTITFWYYEKENNLNRMLLDASSASTTVGQSRWFYAMKTSNRALKFVITDDSGQRFQAITANNALSAANTWDHIGVSWNLNATPGTNKDRILLWINGNLTTTQTFTTSQPLSTAIDTLYIGDNKSTLGVEDNTGTTSNPGTPGKASTTGTIGTGYSAGSTIDEVRIYNFEGGKGLIQRDQNQAASSCLDHYAITHAGTGTTCQTTQVTVTAHDSAHANVLMPNNTTSINLSTSTGKGDWSLAQGYGVLANGMADDGAATYLFNGEYQVVLNLSHTTSGNVNINVTDGQIVESTSEDLLLVVSSCAGPAGFNACEQTTPRCVPTNGSSTYAKLLTKLAGQDFGLDIVALKSDGTRETGFNGQVQVDLVANTATGVSINPATYCPASQTAVIPVATAGVGAGATPADTAGYGKVTASAATILATSPNYRAYRDVRLRFTCNTTHCPPSGLTVCSSDNFAIRPQSFTVTPVTTSTFGANNNSYAGTGGTKQAAGSDIALMATAVPGYDGAPQINRASGLVTSCYGAATGCPTPLSSTALRDINGNTVASFSNATASTGATPNSTFQYHDAGTFQLESGAVYDSTFTSVDQPNDCVQNSYAIVDDDSNANNGVKVGCNIANTAIAGPYGRFYPSYFSYVSGAVTPACAGGFSYFGQTGFGLTYSIEAKSQANPNAADSIRTTRYNASTPTLVASNGTTATNLLTGATPPIAWTGGSGAWASGLYTYTATATAITRPTFSTTGNVGPYDDLYFGTTLAETSLDGVTMTSTRDFSLGNPTCSSGCTHKKLAATGTRVRYGRARLSNAAGSELLDLPLNLALQYWAGASGWQTNTLDTCTAIAAGNLAFTFPASATNLLAACETFATVGGTAPNYTITLAKPGAGNNGWTDISLNLGATAAGSTCTAAGGAYSGSATTANVPWLQFPWTSATAGNPGARATFGIYRSGPVIHRREMF